MAGWLYSGPVVFRVLVLCCFGWCALSGGIWMMALAGAMGLCVIQDGISDLGMGFSGWFWSEGFISSGQPESLILAQNERWRHA
jgi:hypothetical protein